MNIDHDFINSAIPDDSQNISILNWDSGGRNLTGGSLKLSAWLQNAEIMFVCDLCELALYSTLISMYCYIIQQH